MRLRLALALAGATLALGACADDLYGPYGYGGVGVGYAYGGYPYGYGAYPYGYYGGYDPFGWYGDFYYPGVGLYVYDSYRRPHRWSGDQQRYWTSRRANYQARTGSSWSGANWSGFSRSGMSGGRSHHRG
ncbi:MAG TPA: hypothetical protein VE968_04085 [Sphingomicrobium sp.]|nr:hypothetical protein [Sphingomicrobium sp.]